ncbi:MAG TPA: hypothetical protein PKE31_03855 [Pseudomonadota bacterium]|nr:hypothetical protein [Pseudomonadota bacterium]
MNQSLVNLASFAGVVECLLGAHNVQKMRISVYLDAEKSVLKDVQENGLRGPGTECHVKNDAVRSYHTDE